MYLSVIYLRCYFMFYLSTLFSRSIFWFPIDQNRFKKRSALGSVHGLPSWTLSSGLKIVLLRVLDKSSLPIYLMVQVLVGIENIFDLFKLRMLELLVVTDHWVFQIWIILVIQFRVQLSFSVHQVRFDNDTGK